MKRLAMRMYIGTLFPISIRVVTIKTGRKATRFFKKRPLLFGPKLAVFFSLLYVCNQWTVQPVY
jgi:uncharacterized membrane protein